MAVLTGEGRVQIIYGRAALPTHPNRPVYLARPNRVGVHPPVLVHHGDSGLSASVRDLCRRIARHGFVAAAPDLFRGDPPGDLSSVASSRLQADGMEVIDAFASWSSFAAPVPPAVLAVGSSGSTGAQVAGVARGPLVLLGAPLAGLAQVLPDLPGPILGLYDSGAADDVRALHDATGRGRWALFPGVATEFYDDASDDFDHAAFGEAMEELIGFLDRHLAPADV